MRSRRSPSQPRTFVGVRGSSALINPPDVAIPRVCGSRKTRGRSRRIKSSPATIMHVGHPGPADQSRRRWARSPARFPPHPQWPLEEQRLMLALTPGNCSIVRNRKFGCHRSLLSTCALRATRKHRSPGYSDLWHPAPARALHVVRDLSRPPSIHRRRGRPKDLLNLPKPRRGRAGCAAAQIGDHLPPKLASLNGKIRLPRKSVIFPPASIKPPRRRNDRPTSFRSRVIAPAPPGRELGASSAARAEHADFPIVCRSKGA